jgi:hypothetical protein
MHTLIKDIDDWNVVFDSGSGAPYILATIPDVHQAVRLVNYLNGGDGKESGFPFQQLDTEARLYQVMATSNETTARLREQMRAPITEHGR